MKNSNDTIRNRTRDLPGCSAVPQPTAPPRAPPNTEEPGSPGTWRCVEWHLYATQQGVVPEGWYLSQRVVWTPTFGTLHVTILLHARSGVDWLCTPCCRVQGRHKQVECRSVTQNTTRIGKDRCCRSVATPCKCCDHLNEAHRMFHLFVRLFEYRNSSVWFSFTLTSQRQPLYSARSLSPCTSPATVHRPNKCTLEQPI